MNFAHLELSQLHAATCLAITQFSQHKQCPCLANRIVLLLQYLATHPDLPLTSASQNIYLSLLDHWGQVRDELKRQQSIPLPSVWH